MKRNLIAGICSALIMMVVSTTAFSHGEHAKGNKGYLLSSKKDVVTTRYGECWKTTEWKRSLSIPFCEGDGDGDGVADPLDKCPDTPRGQKVDKRGCTIDSDGDGVPDNLDRCPNTPPNTSVDSRGCSNADSDGDGVLNINDKCPNTPQGFEVDADGCALDCDGDGVLNSVDQCPRSKPGAVVQADGCVLRKFVLNDVYFNNDSSSLSGDSTASLDAVVDTLLSIDSQSIVVAGHTDSRGTEDYNLTLSDSRANAVRNYLVGKGVSANLIKAVGYGEASPIASNDTASGRAQNRRVEIDVKQ